MLRFLLLVALVAAALVLVRATPLAQYLEQQRMAAALAELRQTWWAPAVLLLLYAVLCPFGIPATPLVFAGGFVFGTFLGGFYNFLGTFLGAATSFGMGRVLGRDFVAHVAGERLRKVEKLLSRLGFWALARGRLMPIPFPVFNYGAALTGISTPRFLGSSAVGLLPAVVLYTWFAAALAQAAQGERGVLLLKLGGALGGLLLLTLLPPWLEGRKRRRRYQEVLEQRRRRFDGR